MGDSHNSPLLAKSTMKVAFIYRGAENLGIECLSSYLKSHGHEVKLFFDPAVFSGERGSNIPFLAKLSTDWTSRIVYDVWEWRPDMVAFSVYTASYQWSLKLARAIKEKFNVPVVFGGPHPTAEPERVLRRAEVDAVVIGEGEGALLDIIESLDRRGITRTDIPNVGIRKDGDIIINKPRPYIRDLDALPFPDKSLFYEKSHAFSTAYLAMTSRGCPFRCHYCMNSLYPKLYPDERNHVRRQSVDRVISELLPWKGISKIVTFWDDVFPLGEEWLTEFAEKYPREIGLPFLCYVHPRALSLRSAQLLAQAGCKGVKIGVQSITAHGRKFLGRPGSPEDVRRAVSFLREVDIPFSMDHILGLPVESEEDFIETVKFYSDVAPARVNPHWLTYFPGVKLLDEAVQNGVLTAEEAEMVKEGVEQTTFMHPKNNKEKRIQLEASAVMLLDLIPLIGGEAVNFILSFKPFKWFHYNRVLHQLLIVLASLKAGDEEIGGYVRYAFSKKSAP